MRLIVNDTDAAGELVAALRRAGCAAAGITPSTLAVAFPWVTTMSDARQALVELAFFARAWEAAHPGVVVTVVPPRL